jgi:hypothetical protein
MNENIADLRALLFETLRALSDKVKPMEIERAYAISSIAQVIVNSAKVEVDHQRMSGRGWSFVWVLKTDKVLLILIVVRCTPLR